MRHIEEYVESWDVEEDELGILVAPYMEPEREFEPLEIMYHVRVLDGEHQGRYQLDGRYTFEDADFPTILSELYPDIVDQFENAFEDAEIHYYDL